MTRCKFVKLGESFISLDAAQSFVLSQNGKDFAVTFLDGSIEKFENNGEWRLIRSALLESEIDWILCYDNKTLDFDLALRASEVSRVEFLQESEGENRIAEIHFLNDLVLRMFEASVVEKLASQLSSLTIR